MNKNNLKKILFITPEYPPKNTGGGGIVYQTLAEGFTKRGYDITVISADHTAKSFSSDIIKEKINSVNLHRLPLFPNYLNIPVLTTRTPLTPKSRMFLREIITKRQWSGAICYGVLETITLFASQLFRRNNIPYLVSIHGYINPKLYNPLITLIFKLYEKTALKKYISGAEKVISTSSGNAPHLTDIVIPNGIDEKGLTNIIEPINIREKHQIPNENAIIFSLGRIEPNKGFQYVAKAVKNMPKITYIIGGPDKGFKEDIKRINNNIIFTGKLGYEEKKSYFTQSDIIAIPSLVEAFGLVGLEAVAFEKPIIVNPVGGLVDFLHDQKNALYIDIENPNNIGEKINQIITSPNLQQKFTQYDRKIISEYQWSSVINRYIREIDKIT